MCVVMDELSGAAVEMWDWRDCASGKLSHLLS